MAARNEAEAKDPCKVAFEKWVTFKKSRGAIFPDKWGVPWDAFRAGWSRRSEAEVRDATKSA